MSAGPLAGLLLDEATADRPVAISGGQFVWYWKTNCEMPTGSV